MLEELQSLSEAKKKQVLIIATIIIMIVIVGIWAAYFNSTIMGTSQEAAPQAAASDTAAVAPAAAAPQTAQAAGPGLWQNIEHGFGSFVHLFSNPSQYTVQPQSN